jgi:hypothetical protein
MNHSKIENARSLDSNKRKQMHTPPREGMVNSLDTRFQEDRCWAAFGTLLLPGPWRSLGFPEGELAAIAEKLAVSQDVVKDEWLVLRPKVAARLGPLPPAADLDPDVFRKTCSGLRMSVCYHRQWLSIY